MRPVSVDRYPEHHPYSKLVPTASHAEMAALTRSIREAGLFDPVVLLDGQVLDGRSRQTACASLGIMPDYLEFDPEVDGDPVVYVRVQNLDRRHLDESQRAMAAGRLRDAWEEEERKRKEAPPPEERAEDAPPDGAPIGARGKASARAGAAMNVSPRSVERATKVLRKGAPEVQAAVDQGELAVSTAAALADLPFEAQVAALKRFDRATLEAAKLIRAEKRTPDREGSVEHYTPVDIIEAARAVLGEIDLDPASCLEANEVVRAKRFFTVADDGLQQPWDGRVWLNCPYGSDKSGRSRQAAWNAEKLLEEYESGRTTVAVSIVNAVPGDLWFRKMMKRFPVCFTTRTKFRRPRETGEANDQPKQGQAVFYLGPDPLLFAREFEGRGIGIVRWPPELLGEVLVEQLALFQVQGLMLHEAWGRIAAEMGWTEEATEALRG